jgi:hypothetical protein
VPGGLAVQLLGVLRADHELALWRLPVPRLHLPPGTTSGLHVAVEASQVAVGDESLDDRGHRKASRASLSGDARTPSA